MVKLAVVFGTRPEAIKMAPVVSELKRQVGWQVKVVVTGQHREMLHQVLEVFQIQPDYDLDIMTHGQTLEEVTVRVMQGVSEVFRAWRPDLVLVHGDTTTAFAAALAAFYLKIPIGHVEAGLRTIDITNPFPEEANRRLTDVLATYYFAPTDHAARNLLNEGVDKERIFVTGNTVIDALLSVVQENYTFRNPILKALDFSQQIVVVTAHRRENWGEPLHQICRALVEISEANDCQIIVAMHRNPTIQKVMKEHLGNRQGIHLIDGPDYEEFANLLYRCTLLLTDSGGLQEEAPALNKPVLVMREVTERPEGVEAGTVRLVGTNKEEIVGAVTNLLRDKDLYLSMAAAENPYGDGYAARRIRQILEQKLI